MTCRNEAAHATEPDVESAATATLAWIRQQWNNAPSRSTVMVDDVAIACRGWNLDAVDLPGLLLVHGYNAHARWWDHIAPSLISRYRVVAYDMSGAGDSERRVSYSRSGFAREALAVAEAFGFSPVTLMGHSFGGMVGIVASMIAPDKVARLVVADTGIPAQGERFTTIPVHGVKVYPSKADILKRYRLSPPGAWPDPDVFAYIAEHSVVETDTGWRWKFDPTSVEGLNADPMQPLMLSRLTVPTTFIHGSHSEVMRPSRRARAMALAPQAGPSIEIPASHHHLMIEQPIAFAVALAGILSQPPAMPRRDRFSEEQ